MVTANVKINLYFISDEVELACNIIDQLLRVMEPTVVLNRFHNMLLQGLQSSSSQILNLCLHQVRKGHLELLYPLLSKVLFFNL